MSAAWDSVVSEVGTGHSSLVETISTRWCMVSASRRPLTLLSPVLRQGLVTEALVADARPSSQPWGRTTLNTVEGITATGSSQ